MAMDEHLLYADERQGILHLALECGRARPSAAGDVDPEGCAAALDSWLAARAGSPVAELIVCTTRIHHGDLAAIVAVLAARRPVLSALSLGALAFPDFERGSDPGPDPDRDCDGSSWRLELPDLAALLAAVPDLRRLYLAAPPPISLFDGLFERD